MQSTRICPFSSTTLPDRTTTSHAGLASSARKRGSLKHPKLKVAVITGTRAEFGLLTPVMHAIQKHPKLALQVIAGGAHLLPPARTIRDVRAFFPIAATVPMQRPGTSGRHEDALALARGVDGFARAFAKLKPDWVVVLGDRIEAFAAASAASVAGIAVCHIHGGDRAEGIADEAMRHAITKLAHLHCAATKLSAQRIIKMGEKPAHVRITGSPAIDGLSSLKAMSDSEAAKLGDPKAVILLHPHGGTPEQETQWAIKSLLKAQSVTGADRTFDVPSMFANILCLAPNSDSGRELIAEVWQFAEAFGGRTISHLPRAKFLSLLKRLSQRRGVLIGNSSAGLIEAAALGVRVINLGQRQAGREQARNVINIPELRFGTGDAEAGEIRKLLARTPERTTLFGDGRSAARIANLLVKINPREPGLLRKRIVY